LSYPISGRGASGAPPAILFDPPAWWKAALALAVALLLQSTLGQYVAIRGAVPGLVLLLVLWYGMRTDMPSGLLFGTIAGACEDALAGWTGAAWTLSTALVGALAGRTAGTFVTESRLWLVPYAALATVARYAVFVIVLRTEDRAVALPMTHAHALLWQAALNAIVTFAVLSFIPKLGVSRVGLR
jgi:cell shape-determining protein MreD